MFDRSFLDSSAVVVAPQLLGAFLVAGDVRLRITEVEAYLGSEDPGSHAVRGETRRNSAMFGEPGRLYTYFTYGMHTCANVVCSPTGTPSAVLVRAGEIVEGISVARARRLTSRVDSDLARGPARLCVALGITLADNGDDLAGGRIRLEPRPAASVVPMIAAGPRTGVAGAGGERRFPWRFWIPGDPTVSPYRAHRARKREPSS